MKKATANLFLDTRKESSDNKFPVKLTIYFRPDKKRYGVAIDVTKDEWQKLNGKRLKDEDLKEKKIKLTAITSKANKILEDLDVISFISFERAFFKVSVGNAEASLNYWFNEYIKLLNKEDRVGTRILYNTTLNSLENYKSRLKLTDVTKEFLLAYEGHMTSHGKSPSTIGIYLRNLRSIINIAIKDGILSRDNYPFKGYKIPTARNVKKALSDAELQVLLNYQPKTKAQLLAYDFWVLSYLCSGMNFTDILHLSPGNIDGNFLSFYRQKTKRTKKRDLRPIKICLHPRAIEIIERWKDKHEPASYLFPILEQGLTAKAIKNRTQRFIKKVNKGMDEIRMDFNFPNRLGTYVARHSFSSRPDKK
jgi:integrase/recombinase XerD